MIVLDHRQLRGTDRDAAGPGWTSLRLLVKSDGMGFSMTETQVLPGAVLRLEYKHHIEACYCIGGAGTVIELDSGTRHEITPGVLYAPNAHDRHEVHVPEDGEALHLICVFSPALQGDEVHGPDGSYAAPEG
ncbi:ectoine synthase [Sulfitobacter mediterraneus]|uniref:L-ectoine synthase n=1 Tax=Sulfitobacter mediterraneus TaxID=83219 RepID=A0A2T6CBP9_9RHOB|nr:ectoine synthase [Sulfitobacter mediterraneus]KIN79338.1 putative L-ectoine synthase [Sulfitobacter mediterraneus KCTC 32188]MBM1311383.1 ectoine synthase [Sulfitobacter mediterraneus]MBM1315265.1 ectoine synthase [Sulfitobacter mediterraneus]MBM1323626.1 ectoine synthase [Sulfitobacter mediterraneus]MBM1327538.1 ectoine synthase [Sulfitobacter mediterraneus]